MSNLNNEDEEAIFVASDAIKGAVADAVITPHAQQTSTISKLDSAPTAYTFDDFFLSPVHSNVISRRDPDLSVDMGQFKYKVPIIASPMNTVTGGEMLEVMSEAGGTGVLHRFMSIEDQVNIAKTANATDFWVAVGIKDHERVEALYHAGVRRFCIDTANGHAVYCVDAVYQMRKSYPKAQIMAGNVCSYDGALRLARAGANAIRSGLGSGAVCSTRIVTGHGVPQLTALERCLQAKREYPELVVISDGGMRCSGDIVKSLALGADAVMLGSMLAGTSATPGQLHTNIETGHRYKYYHGMASAAARSEWYDREQNTFVPEGESVKMPYKGLTEDVLGKILGGIRSGMSYSNALTLDTLRKNAQWNRVTNSGSREAHPHAKYQ